MNDAAAPVQPLRHLGRFRLVALGINSVIGGGIFIMPATVAALVGPASLAAYLLAGTVVIGVGLALASLASRLVAHAFPQKDKGGRTGARRSSFPQCL